MQLAKRGPVRRHSASTDRVELATKADSMSFRIQVQGSASKEKRACQEIDASGEGERQPHHCTDERRFRRKGVSES